MYRSTATFPEICSYISPGTAHEKWVKTYSAKLSKLWFPYEWFDTAEKLDFPGMPPHEEWFSKLNNEMTLSEEAYRLVSESGRKKGCELLRFCCSFTTIWISSLLLKPWSQSEIPTRGWESIFSKMRYLFCVARLTKETLRSCTPQGRRPTKFSKAQLSGGGGGGCLVENENPYAQVQRREDVSKSYGLRRKRAVSKHNGGRCAMGANAKERRKVYQSSAERQMVWIRLSGHRGAKRVMDEVRRNAAVVLKQTRSKRDYTAAHERLLGAQQTQTRPTKTGWRPFRPKDPVARAAAEMVSLP